MSNCATFDVLHEKVVAAEVDSVAAAWRVGPGMLTSDPEAVTASIAAMSVSGARFERLAHMVKCESCRERLRVIARQTAWRARDGAAVG